MKSLDVWLVGFGLRCLVLLVVELGTFLFVVPTLFDLHSNLADLGAALAALLALAGGLIAGVLLTREATALFSKDDQ